MPAYLLRLVCAAFACCLLVAAAAAAQDDRQPVPSLAEQKQAVERIKSIFPKEYASTTRSVRADLGQELLKLAEAETDPIPQFALYREAIQVASTAGDFTTAMTAIGGLEADFQVNVLAIKAFALESLAKTTATKEDWESVADAALDVAQQQIADNRFADAKKTLASGFNVAKKLRGTEHAARLKVATESIDDIANRFAKVADAAAKLKTSPDDAAANLEMGHFECFDKGNWEKGLAHLAKSSDATLKKLAAQSLAEPDSADQQYEIAESWWKAAEKLPPLSQSRVRGYASRWYQEALPGLSGLSRAMAQKRVDEVKPSADTTAASRGPRRIGLLKQLDPAEDFQPKNKWKIEKGLLACVEGHLVPKVIFPYQPPEEYDVKLSFAQPDLRNGVSIIMPNPNGGQSFRFGVGGNSGQNVCVSSDQGTYSRNVPNLIRRNTKYTIIFRKRKAGIQATINGVAVLDMKTDYSDLKVDYWHRIDKWENLAICCDDPTVFYEVEVTEVTGEGAMTRFPKDD